MYKVDFSNLDTENMVVSGVLTENANLILDNKHPCTGFGWLNIQEDSCDKCCEAVIASQEILKFCAAHRENLKIGSHIKITGLGIRRDGMDYLYLDDESGIEIIQNYKKQETIMPKDITEIIGKLANDVNIEEAGGEDYITLGVDVRYEVLVKKRDLDMS